MKEIFQSLIVSRSVPEYFWPHLDSNWKIGAFWYALNETNGVLVVKEILLELVQRDINDLYDIETLLTSVHDRLLKSWSFTLHEHIIHIVPRLMEHYDMSLVDETGTNVTRAGLNITEHTYVPYWVIDLGGATWEKMYNSVLQYQLIAFPYEVVEITNVFFCQQIEITSTDLTADDQSTIYLRDYNTMVQPSNYFTFMYNGILIYRVCAKTLGFVPRIASSSAAFPSIVCLLQLIASIMCYTAV